MNVMDILELVDIWRLKYPDLVRYTWRKLNQASRLAYFLMSFSLHKSVDRGQNAVGSSHYLHILRLQNFHVGDDVGTLIKAYWMITCF